MTGERFRLGAAAGLLTLLAGCGSPSDTESATDPGMGGVAGADIPLAEEFVRPPGCRPGPGASGSPQSIEGIVTLVNSLPRPVSLTCFLESLDRPLEMEVAESTLSAQLSEGARSPRIFVFSGSVIMTVTPEGIGHHLLELGEVIDEQRSIKAEIEFPVRSVLDDEAPFEQVLFNGGPVTNCAFCHADEQEYGAESVATTSIALRPLDRLLLPLKRLQQEHEACEPEREPERCAFFSALLDQGPVTHRSFPETFPTFGN